MGRMHNPPHPGAVLQEWLAEVSVTQAAAELGVTRAYLSRILHGHADVSADMALRLSALLGTSAEMWLGMQSALRPVASISAAAPCGHAYGVRGGPCVG